MSNGTIPTCSNPGQTPKKAVRVFDVSPQKPFLTKVCFSSSVMTGQSSISEFVIFQDDGNTGNIFVKDM